MKRDGAFQHPPAECQVSCRGPVIYDMPIRRFEDLMPRKVGPHSRHNGSSGGASRRAPDTIDIDEHVRIMNELAFIRKILEASEAAAPPVQIGLGRKGRPRSHRPSSYAYGRTTVFRSRAQAE